MIIADKPRWGIDCRRLPRPYPSFLRPWPAAERPRMTIAIGRLCTNGLIIAADTKICPSDGSTQYARKVHRKRAANGAFVIAYACNDVDAARTLREDLFEVLLRNDPETLRQVEEIIRSGMVKWAESYTHDLPWIDLILGVSLRAPRSSDRDLCGGTGLYHCRPPAIMVRKSYNQTEPTSFISIGSGATLADSIMTSLFTGKSENPKDSLKQLAYILYRVKKDLGQWCGGFTNAYFMCEGEVDAFEISPACMDHAENAGEMLDQLLKIATWAIQSSELEISDLYLERLRNYLKVMESYRLLDFSVLYGKEICEDGIRQLDPQT